MPSRASQNAERPLGELLREAREEAVQFLATRVRLASAELTEKSATLKVLAPAAVIGFVLAAMAFVLLSLALAALIAHQMGGAAGAWAAGLAVVGLLYGMVGGGCLLYALSVLRSGRLVPERTLRVLKQDRDWIQCEARIKP